MTCPFYPCLDIEALPGTPCGNHTCRVCDATRRVGGVPVNKLSENGSFASTQTSFCNLIQITPANLILDAFERMELSLHTNALPLWA